MNDLLSTNLTMSSREIAALTEKRHDNVMADIRKMLKELEIDRLKFQAAEKDAKGEERSVFNLPKRETLILVSGYNIKLRAKIIDRWEELECQVAQPLPQSQDPTLALYMAAAATLRLPESGKLTMLKLAGKAIGADTSFLPGHTEDNEGGSRPTASATQLLKDHGVRTSAFKFNRLLETEGLLTRLSRKASGGGVKHFWSVTERGLAFGKNLTSDKNPNETQPHWYRDTFEELIDRALYL